MHLLQMKFLMLQYEIQQNPSDQQIPVKQMLLNNLILKRDKSPMTLTLYSHIINLGNISLSLYLVTLLQS